MENVPLAEDSSSIGKRKRSRGNLVDLPEPASVAGHSATENVQQSLPVGKRARLLVSLIGAPASPDPVLGRLPRKVLQRICSFLDITSLGRLVCVSRRFRALLDPRVPWPFEQEQEHHQNLILTRDELWHDLKAHNFSDMPQSSHRSTAYEILCLVLGTSCQLCGQSPSSIGSVAERVQLIWPFQIRYCTSCLASRILKVGAPTD